MIFGCKAEQVLSLNDKMILEFSRCILKHCDPVTMTVVFPDVLNNIGGERIDQIQIMNSYSKIPKAKLSIIGNRMIGPNVA